MNIIESKLEVIWQSCVILCSDTAGPTLEYLNGHCAYYMGKQLGMSLSEQGRHSGQ